MALEPTTLTSSFGDENGILDQLIGDDNWGTKGNKKIKEVLGPSGSASRATTRRDEPGV